MGTPSPVSVVPSFVKPPPGFSDLYQRYSETVYRAALRVTGNAADAEDVLQSVFLRMIDNPVTLDPAWLPEPYFRRAATAIDERREYGSREDTALLKERLRRALAKLPPEDAQLIVLCYLEGYSYDELAEQFQVERGTVGSRLHRIRTVLQKHLSK